MDESSTTASTTVGTATTPEENDTESTTENIETTDVHTNPTESNEEATEPESITTTIRTEEQTGWAREKKQFTKAFLHATPTHKDAAAQATLPLINGDNEPLLLTPRRSREIAVQTSIEQYELKELGRSFKNAATATTTTTTTASTNSINNRRRLPAIFRYDNEDIKTYSTLGSSRDDDDIEDKKCEYSIWNLINFSTSIMGSE